MSRPEPEPEPPPERGAPAAAYRRDEVLELLAAYGERRPEQVPEVIDSLELAWLVHQLEQRYGGPLDLDDGVLARMCTVSGAAGVLEELRLDAGAADG